MRRFGRPTYLQTYGTLTVAALLAVMATNWLVDPLHFYHRPYVHGTFVTNQRYQNPGLAKNYEYDAVVIGTSHTENFSPRQMGEVLGWRVLPLAISGSTAREQRLILTKALESGQVRRVLWGLDFNSFRCEPDEVRLEYGDFPLFLYEETPLTPVRYLLSRDTLNFSRRALAGKGARDLESLHAWPEKFEFSEERVLAAWRFERASSGRKMRAIGGALRRPVDEALRENVRVNLVELVERHPEVEFHLFFPPYSILTYVNDFARADDQFADRMRFKEQVVHELGNNAHCRLYDFETAFEVTHDLGNYKDLWHYGRRINDFIVEAIARNEHRIDRDNAPELLARFESSVHQFVRQVLDPHNAWHARLEIDRYPLHVGELRASAGKVAARKGPAAQ